MRILHFFVNLLTKLPLFAIIEAEISTGVSRQNNFRILPSDFNIRFCEIRRTYRGGDMPTAIRAPFLHFDRGGIRRWHILKKRKQVYFQKEVA